MVRDALSKGTIYLLLSLGGVLMLLPFLWMLSTSLKAPNQVAVLPPAWVPVPPHWENYAEALRMAPFGRYFVNSVIVTTLSTIGELLTTILAAYAFARIRFWGREVLFSLLLGTMMVPGEVLLVPNYLTLTKLGWIDTYAALIVPWTASVFAIFLYRQHLLSVPRELGYAARVDGAGDFRFLWEILVPITKPALVTIALLKAIGSWNAFLWPLIVTNSREMRTLPVGLTAFTTEAGTAYELLMAASAFVIVPMVVLFLLFQRHIVEGISRAGIKG
ncbi:MAG: N-Acetyl-D-glucosamine ABC transport system, permease protein 2 [Brockia lithotrophica]|uniref:N-Acetyl-D-glucosamine ABC transport system, permease protein 2 n=1 Tax=Brockia lithotrophica TaxID=933949 RepID=A0A2T5G6B8_9BACL|nr:MAG: N-Acetyl-D-glucosamine ABC transport system, permease protein 2 [Brockia lithotrophica]